MPCRRRAYGRSARARERTASEQFGPLLSCWVEKRLKIKGRVRAFSVLSVVTAERDDGAAYVDVMCGTISPDTVSKWSDPASLTLCVGRVIASNGKVRRHVTRAAAPTGTRENRAHQKSQVFLWLAYSASTTRRTMVTRLARTHFDGGGSVLADSVKRE